MKNLKVIGLVVAAAGIIFLTAKYKSGGLKRPLIFSPQFMLSALWGSYKKEYFDANSGRVHDRQQNDLTTSEGQSYALLRAVWQDDKPSFDKAWEWTRQNLQKPDGSLFSWAYGQRADGTTGILTDRGGINSASDADIDIALALVFAGYRWQNEEYLEEAKAVINGIWEREVVEVNGKYVLASNDVEKNFSDPVLFNPSYFAPYAFRIFSRLTPQHDWQGLINSSYELLTQSVEEKLDNKSACGLPPDWATIDRLTGKLEAPVGASNLSVNYGYDAMRIPFRLALDWEWFKEPRAKEFLGKMSFLGNQWKSRKQLSSVYSHACERLSDTEAPAMYGASVGYFMTVGDPALKEFVDNKLHQLYSPDSANWIRPLSYYDSNWAWFGLALYHKQLFDLSAEKERN